MKQKAQKAPATATTESSDPPTLTPQPATVKTPVSVAKPGTPPVAKPPLAPGSATAPPPAKSIARTPSPEDRQILWTFYTQTVRPFLANTQSTATVRRSPLMSDVDAGRQFREVQASLPVAHQALLDELQQFSNVRRQIEQQRTILRWMHWWLALHIPASLLLIVFTLAHIVMALRVVPFRF
jgi:hypothetical protein